jgi:hypothetical protein
MGQSVTWRMTSSCASAVRANQLIKDTRIIQLLGLSSYGDPASHFCLFNHFNPSFDHECVCFPSGPSLHVTNLYISFCLIASCMLTPLANPLNPVMRFMACIFERYFSFYLFRSTRGTVEAQVWSPILLKQFCMSYTESSIETRTQTHDKLNGLTFPVKVYII